MFWGIVSMMHHPKVYSVYLRAQNSTSNDKNNLGLVLLVIALFVFYTLGHPLVEQETMVHFLRVRKSKSLVIEMETPLLVQNSATANQP